MPVSTQHLTLPVLIAIILLACCPALPAQSAGSTIATRHPVILGYRATFNDEGISGHHVNFGVGRLVENFASHHPVGTLLTATLEVGYSKGHIVVAPLISGYLAGGAAGIALGVQGGILTDGKKVHALLRPAIGTGLLSAEKNGFLLYYAHSFTIPWEQSLVARNVGAIDITAIPGK